MAGYKETPRQKMIAMMYLVLTALLALNVSKEILNAFIVVNESTEATNETISDKINGTYAKFRQQMAINPNKVGPFFEKAMQVQELSEDIVSYIDSVKWAVIIATDARTETVEQAKNTPLGDIKSIDRYTEPTRFFFGQSEDGSGGESGRLRRKIDAYRVQMLEIMGEPSESERLGMKTTGDYRDADKKPQNWERHNFFYTVLAADVAILNKLITEVRSAEFDVISYLYGSVSAEDFKFDEIDAKVIPRSRYVFEGEEYEAEIIVAAYDTKQNPEVYYIEGVDTVMDIASARQIEGEKGVVKLSLPATTTGIKKYAGIVEIVNPSGDKVRYSFKDEYVVGKPGLTVSATKMNVFYTSVDNPVSISVPGVAIDRIRPRINVGTLTPDETGENYIVRIPGDETGIATITVDADYSGELRSMGSAEFRIKRVPDPIAYVANVHEGNVPKNLLLASALIPRMPDDFDFDLNFIIVSYSFVSVQSGGDIFKREITGNVLTEDLRNFISNARRGTKVWFENIIARGPDGSNRRISPVNITIQ